MWIYPNQYFQLVSVLKAYENLISETICSLHSTKAGGPTFAYIRNKILTSFHQCRCAQHSLYPTPLNTYFHILIDVIFICKAVINRKHLAKKKKIKTLRYDSSKCHLHINIVLPAIFQFLPLCVSYVNLLIMEPNSILLVPL